MAKHLKVNIKNTQIAKAVNLSGIKNKLEKKKGSEKEKASEKEKKEIKKTEKEKKSASRARARSTSAFTKEEEIVRPEAKLEGPVEIKAKETIETKAKPQENKAEKEVQATTPKVKKEPEKKKPESKKDVKLGPTGKHIKDLLPPKKPKKEPDKKSTPKQTGENRSEPQTVKETETTNPKEKKPVKFREFRDVKPTTRRQTQQRAFDSRDRHGLRAGEDEFSRHRKRRPAKSELSKAQDLLTVRPTELKIRIPISIKDLASEMKLKASQLIGKLLNHGVVIRINDALDDETTIQLLGEEFGCAISIDTSEEERIRITDKSIAEEIAESDADQLITRAPVVAFMGHVDHGKTSLIDKIRLSNIASGEAGAITQHIGAFKCPTIEGDIAILDTPGHEAFSAMRERGANVTDIVVLVIAGDEGMRQQTIEAIQHAKAAGVTIVVAINKCDKPNFNADNVYRQLSEQELLPEAWGGQTITVNCSAITGDGIDTLLQMLALQAEILELKANSSHRARGSILESEMHKGLGAVATVLVQNGTLNKGDALVSDTFYGRVKTMHDEHGKLLEKAGPSTPVEITGLSGLPEAGQEFIVVKDEREAKKIADARRSQVRQRSLTQSKTGGLEDLMAQAQEAEKVKIFKVIVCADVQGSLEAINTALKKIKSDKIQLEIISTGVGEISESDIERAQTSDAVIVGFHTKMESHAENILKRNPVKVCMHDVIYHAIDEIKSLMRDSLDKIAQEEEEGKLTIQAVFKSSQLGNIAGCIVTEGSVHRNHHIRVVRDGELIWTGTIASLKRLQEDVREVQKGLECGIVLDGFKEIQEDDELQTYTIHYIMQDL